MFLHHTILLSIFSLLSLIHAIPFTPLPPSPLSKRDRVLQCHTPKPNYTPVRPVVAHCLLAIRLITACSEKSHAPMQFSPTTGFVVPHTWRHQTCEVEIKAVDPFGLTEDTFTLYEVADRARDVVGVCINSMRFQLGGRATVGPKDEFWVAVASTNTPETTQRPSRFAPDQCFWT